jgi:hypothetical protein
MLPASGGEVKPGALLVLSLLLSSSLAAHDPLLSPADPGSTRHEVRGFVIQVLPEERAVVTWFTYPPVGEDGAQA